jgi:hypothetical protein
MKARIAATLSQGFAYAEFEGLEGVCAAVALSGTSIKGRSLHILRSRPPRAADAADHTAFIKGLGEGVGEAELRQLLGDAPGGIRDVRLPKDETGAFKVGGGAVGWLLLVTGSVRH